MGAFSRVRGWATDDVGAFSRMRGVGGTDDVGAFSRMRGWAALTMWVPSVW